MTRSRTPICGAARPTPSSACIVSSMSSIKLWIGASTRFTLIDFMRSRGFSYVRTGRTANVRLHGSFHQNCTTRFPVGRGLVPRRQLAEATTADGWGQAPSLPDGDCRGLLRALGHCFLDQLEIALRKHVHVALEGQVPVLQRPLARVFHL